MADEIISGRRLNELPFVDDVLGSEAYVEKNGASARVKVGEPNGLATLDENGLVPTDQVGVASTELVQVDVAAGQTVVEFPGVVGVGHIVFLFYNGVMQNPSSYSADGGTVTFIDALTAPGSCTALVTGIPAGDVSAGNISATPAGSGAVTRTVNDTLRDMISGAGYATPADAVAQAVAESGSVFWPAGDHVAVASVPNLWDVDHSGPGRIVRGAAIVPMSPRETDTITIYVDPAGNDANDGITSDYPMATIQRALDVFVEHGSRGRWVIQLAAGTYVENVSVSSMTPMEFPLDIQGPGVGGHPNVPTAIISAATPSTDVFSLSDGGWARLFDVRLSGASTASAISAQRARIGATNVHVDGCLNGPTTVHGAFISASGGIWTGLGAGVSGGNGYRSYYNSTHSIVGSSAADATVIEDFELGMLISEGCQGHLDYTVIQDCTTGARITRGAGGNNTAGMTVQRCGVGIDARNQWFNNNIAFGTGVDANTVNVRCSGDAPEYDFRAADYSTKTMRVQQETNLSAHTGTTAATTVWTSPSMRDWMVSERGDVNEINVSFRCSPALAGTCMVRLFIDDGTTQDLLTSVTLPAGTTAGVLRCGVNHTSASAQRAYMTLVHSAGASAAEGDGALPLKGKSFTYFMDFTLSNAADSVVARTLDFRTTLGG